VVKAILSFFIASLLGILAGIGVGGGSLLLLWLTQVMLLEQPQARIINLLFYLPAALICTFLRRKDMPFHPDVIWPAIITGCISAVIFTLISRHIDVTLLKKLLGVLLLYMGVREIRYRPR